MSKENGKEVKTHTVYKNAEGKRVIGVTTALGILDKPALVYWSWDLGCKGIDYRKYKDDKASIGTLLHAMILEDLGGELCNKDDFTKNQIDIAETCFIKFLDWKQAHKIEPILLETPMVSEEYQYGGTFDFYGKVDDKLTLLDMKTGKSVYLEMAYQLSAYKQLLEEEGHKVEATGIIRVGRNEQEGFEQRMFYNLDKHFELFKHCLAIYQLKKETK